MCRKPWPAKEPKQWRGQEQARSKKTHCLPVKNRRTSEQVVAKWEDWNADVVDLTERSGDDCKRV